MNKTGSTLICKMNLVIPRKHVIWNLANSKIHTTVQTIRMWNKMKNETHLFVVAIEKLCMHNPQATFRSAKLSSYRT